jgi:hypothetical protein
VRTKRTKVLVPGFRRGESVRHKSPSQAGKDRTTCFSANQSMKVSPRGRTGVRSCCGAKLSKTCQAQEDAWCRPALKSVLPHFRCSLETVALRHSLSILKLLSRKNGIGQMACRLCLDYWGTTTCVVLGPTSLHRKCGRTDLSAARQEGSSTRESKRCDHLIR